MAYYASNPQGNKGPMSGRLVDQPGIPGANPNHLRLMIECLCKRDNRSFPQVDTKSQREMALWLKNAYPNDDIDWADQQVKDFYRAQGSPHRALRGRGRPVGAKNKYRPQDGATPIYSEVPNHGDILKPVIEAKNNKALTNADDYVPMPDFVRHIRDNADESERVRKAIELIAEAEQNNAQGLLKLNDRVSAIVEHRPTIIELKRPDLPSINLGLQHKYFPKLLNACNAALTNNRRLNIYIVGPAATGKTHASEQVHKALFNGTYLFRSCGMSIFAHEFMGYYHGDKYVRSQFREAFEHGGIFVADEFDRYAASATVALNNCLAGTQAAFPDGMVTRHPDFIFIACANTSGRGATMDYNTANKQDASTMNRFIVLDWPIDEAIEDALAYNKDWLEIVRKVRKGVENIALKGVMITTRQMMDGQALISAGFTIEEAEQACLRQGMDDNQWQRVKNNHS